ncbi:MAG: hypothetical protein JST00_05125 [Deltaproteobacteria bacterium]|nr:hypothetical protein [Deltaproteobacteria bacterium]
MKTILLSPVALLLGLLGVCAGCSTEAGPSDPLSAPPPPKAGSDGERPATEPPEPPLPACATNVVPLKLEYGLETVDTQLVPVRTATEEGWLTLDTGSALTFVYGKDDASRRYDVTIGCETLKVIRRDFARSNHAGKPILGVLGADFLTTSLSELDYPGGRIVRHLDARSRPDATDGYAPASILDARGHIAVRAEVDGTSRLLMVDTGSPNVLLVPAQGRPSDRRTTLQDVTGADVNGYVGDSNVTLGSETKRVPVWRIPSWPYFEGYQKEIHPELSGLFGLSALGFRRVVFDAKAGVMKLGPMQRLPTR